MSRTTIGKKIELYVINFEINMWKCIVKQRRSSKQNNMSKKRINIGVDIEYYQTMFYKMYITMSQYFSVIFHEKQKPLNGSTQVIKRYIFEILQINIRK